MPAIRRSESGRLLTLSADDLFKEYRQTVAAQQDSWDLSSNQIDPQLLVQLFQLLSQGPTLERALAVDLARNCLEPASVSELAQVVSALLSSKLQRMWVRFGFEVPLEDLKEAISSTAGAHHLWQTRIEVTSPFLTPSLTQLTDRLAQSTFNQQKQLSCQQKIINVLLKRKDPHEELKQMRDDQHINDRLLEASVSAAVAAELAEGVVVQETGYDFRARAGDLDGLITGQVGGKFVVVLVEAKHNMDSMYKKAQSELFSAHEYWCYLRASLREELDEQERADYDELHVAELKDAESMFAFGAVKFGDEVVRRHFSDLRTPWFRVGFDAAQNSAFKVLNFSPASS